MAAPAAERTNASAYFRFSRKLTSSGPAVSSGLTSKKSRSPSSGRSSLAPLSSASAPSAKGPARPKKRGSAICLPACQYRALYFFLGFGLAAAGALAPAGGGAGAGTGRRSGGDEVDGEGRHFLVELLQDFIRHVEPLVE